MAEVRTIQVKSKDHNGEIVVINESDFNEEQHERVTPEGEAVVTGAPVHYARAGQPVNEPHKPTGQGAIERNLPPNGVELPSEWFRPENGGILHGIAEQQELETVRNEGARTARERYENVVAGKIEEGEPTGSVVIDSLREGKAVPASLASAGVEPEKPGVEAIDPVANRGIEGTANAEAPTVAAARRRANAKPTAPKDEQ